MISDADMVALNCFEEAAGEIDDGKAAIARVTLNRIKRKFESDGTVAGTVLAHDQFSWAWFEFVTVHTGTATHDVSHQEYQRVSFTAGDALNRAAGLLASVKSKFPKTFGRCSDIAHGVFGNAYNGTLYNQLTDDALMYLNPRILTKLPSWAIPARKLCSIGHHDFYRADDPPAMV